MNITTCIFNYPTIHSQIANMLCAKDDRLRTPLPSHSNAANEESHRYLVYEKKISPRIRPSKRILLRQTWP